MRPGYLYNENYFIGRPVLYEEANISRFLEWWYAKLSPLLTLPEKHRVACVFEFKSNYVNDKHILVKLSKRLIYALQPRCNAANTVRMEG